MCVHVYKHMISLHKYTNYECIGLNCHMSSGIVQPPVFEESFNLIIEFQFQWSHFNGTWQKRHRDPDNRWRFEIREMTLQMQ